MNKNFYFPKRINVDTNVSMSEFTRIKIGGKSDYFAEVSSQKKFIELVKFCFQNNLPMRVLGEGSNVFISDSGYRGLIAIIKFENFRFLSETVISVEAGAPLSMLNAFSFNYNLTGLEFSAGIPGTVGGAIYGNAGAYGKNVGECLSRVRLITPNGKIKLIHPKHLNFGYRYSGLKDNQNILLEAEFRLQKGISSKILERVNEILKIREQKLPSKNTPSAGSYFKNLKDEMGNPIAAAKYLDSVGSKDIRVGDAAIFHKHANIIINKGQATANDVLKLEEILKTKVKDKYNVNLEREVIYID